MKKILELFITMVKIGLFTFGGGYAMIALLENEFVSKKKWIENDEFMNMVAIAESTPGPIAINAATYIGYKLKGILGAVFCTIGVCLPSFIIIYIISLFFNLFLSIEWIAAAFKGIQVCVIYLIFSAGIKMLKKINKNIINVSIISITLILMIVFTLFSIKFSSVFYILISGIIGEVLFLLKNFKKEELPNDSN